MKVIDFMKKHSAKIATSGAVAGALSVASTVGSFAAEGDYTIKPVPTAQVMDLTLLGNLWNYAQSMLQDTISIISSQPQLQRGCINMVNA